MTLDEFVQRAYLAALAGSNANVELAGRRPSVANEWCAASAEIAQQWYEKRYTDEGKHK
jgi:hypothetical protein